MNEEQTLPVAAETSAVEDTEGGAAVSEPFGDETVTEAAPSPTPAAAQTAETGNANQTDDDDAQQLHTRLANEFRVLAAEIPQIRAFSDLPDAVVTMAVEQNVSLFDAYLRHSFYENRRIGEAVQAGERAASMSVGSLAAPPETLHPEVDAFVQALRQSLR